MDAVDPEQPGSGRPSCEEVERLMDRKRLLKITVRVVAAGAAIAVVAFLGISLWIGHDVASHCSKAKDVYGGDCVQALTEQLDDETQNYRSRNNAIWALGQLGDRRALPVLREYYVGWAGEGDSWDNALSQYELKKALNWLEGDANFGRFIWRFAVD
ncbi:MAG: hypothetical protein QG608_813 [Actinomycetota bacterium]|nr:hypothetical protein [Actinomycetota bacterium]